MPRLLLLAALAVLPYLTSLPLPFISDDYEQIARARQYGAPAQWGELAKDPLYRCRATSLVLTRATEAVAGLNPVAYRATSLALHLLAVFAVLWLAALAGAPPNVAFAAAAFFAVQEGHQEAVIWYAAVPELLVFLCCAATVGAWLLWQRSGDARWYFAALAAFLAALASKESAVAVVPVLALLALARRRWPAALPFGILAVLYFLASWTAARDHLHFNDGTFRIHAGALWNWANSFARLFWIWGLAALAALAATGFWRKHPTLLAQAFLWIGSALVPYCFLTYMDRVPSRHTYLASAGLAVVVGLGYTALESHRRLALAAALAVVLHNAGYVWVKKQPQFARRAEPTEQVIAFAQQHRAPFTLECFPYSDWIAIRAVEVGAGLPPSLVRPKGSPAPARFCYAGKL
ncbi:MAG: hypothetical protein SFV54_21465 [Bryobacteraceae bacterium]|nr:hypothetical protein [Bryobacteraceae bacterium]